MANNLLSIRNRIVELWDLLKLSRAETDFFRPFFAYQESEAVLNIHKLEVRRLEELYDKNREPWQCLLCQTIGAVPKVERSHSGLKPNERRVAERVFLEIYCQYDTSIHFRAPVHPQKKVRFPMSFNEIREKLSKGRSGGSPGNPVRYRNVRQFIRDI
jgi:hypothetical protein